MNAAASASAKTILFGEHAVVYGEPAIAIPLINTRTFVHIYPGEGEFRVVSPVIGMDCPFSALDKESGLFHLLSLLMQEFGIDELPGDVMKISGSIPIASGLGSGAALSVAVIRAFAKRFNRTTDTETVNRLAFEIEKIYHGTPSGIDNTVIAYEHPVIFRKCEGVTLLQADLSFLHLLVVDSGIRSRTIDVVSDVRDHFDQNEKYIREIGRLVPEAASALEKGLTEDIGRMMNENQRLLQAIRVSSPELDDLIGIAIRSGAAGAKLTGAGRGGNIIVLAKNEDQADSLRTLYRSIGAKVIL